jgi:hypothetical protein
LLSESCACHKRFPALEKQTFWCSRYLDQQLGWQPIIELRDGHDRKPSSFAKIGVVLEEADETVFWLEMLSDSGLVRPAKLQGLLSEATQLVAIFTASRKTARE